MYLVLLLPRVFHVPGLETKKVNYMLKLYIDKKNKKTDNGDKKSVCKHFHNVN